MHRFIRKFVFIFITVLFCASAYSQMSSVSNKTSKDKSAKELEKEREKARIERKAAADKQDAYEEAVETFQLNKPAEAIPLLETFLGDAKSEAYNPDVYVYLSVAYFQTKEYQKSIDVCELGLSKEDTNFKVLYFNEGNAAYALGWYKKAAELYEKSLEIDATYAPAELNLANANLRQDEIEKARDNYIRYLELKPETVQRPEIEKMIGLLDEEIAYRANQKPELVDAELREDKTNAEIPIPAEIISTDDIIRNQIDDGSEGPREYMSDSDTEAPDLPPVVEKKVKKSNGEAVNKNDSSAPELPVEKKSKKSNGEAVNKSDSSAPELPSDSAAKKTSTKKREEKISTSETVAPAVPSDSKKVPKVKEEKVKDRVPALPDETKKKEKMEKIGTQEPPKLPEDMESEKKKLLDSYGGYDGELPDADDILDSEYSSTSLEVSPDTIDAK